MNEGLSAIDIISNKLSPSLCSTPTFLFDDKADLQYALPMQTVRILLHSWHAPSLYQFEDQQILLLTVVDIVKHMISANDPWHSYCIARSVHFPNDETKVFFSSTSHFSKDAI